MVLFNHSTRELTAKVVYYGPGLCGKTTNLRVLHERLDKNSVGKLLSLSTAQDRTIYFDLLPVELGNIKGYTVRFQLCTVPGQVFYNETRKLVLKGVDGIVFIVDSQRSMLPRNLESFQNLKDNLQEVDRSLEGIPLVVQYNKRDLEAAVPLPELQEALSFQDLPFVEAISSQGQGVVETFKFISRITFTDLLKRLQKSGPMESVWDALIDKPRPKDPIPPQLQAATVRMPLPTDKLTSQLTPTTPVPATMKDRFSALRDPSRPTLQAAPQTVRFHPGPTPTLAQAPTLAPAPDPIPIPIPVPDPAPSSERLPAPPPTLETPFELAKGWPPAASDVFPLSRRTAAPRPPEVTPPVPLELEKPVAPSADPSARADSSPARLQSPVLKEATKVQRGGSGAFRAISNLDLVRALSEGSPAPAREASPEIRKLQERISILEERLQVLTQKAEGPKEDPRVAEILDVLEAIHSRIDVETSDIRQQLTGQQDKNEVQTAISGLEQRVGELGSLMVALPEDSRISALTQKVESLNSRLESFPLERFVKRLGMLESMLPRIEAVDGAMGQLTCDTLTFQKDLQALGILPSRISEIETRLSESTGRLSAELFRYRDDAMQKSLDVAASVEALHTEMTSLRELIGTETARQEESRKEVLEALSKLEKAASESRITSAEKELENEKRMRALEERAHRTQDVLRRALEELSPSSSTDPSETGDLPANPHER